MTEPILHLMPSGSCLIKSLVLSLKETNIKFKVFDNLMEMSGDEEVPDFVFNFTNPKTPDTYANSIKDTISWLDNAFSFNKPFLILASSVGIQPEFIDLGNLDQIEYNIDRKNAEKLFLNSHSSGLILRIPLVPCKDDSLLKRFKDGTTTSKDLKNRNKKIPVMPVWTFCDETIKFIRSFWVAKDIQLNIIVIDYSANRYSIETLQKSLANSDILDYLIKQ